MSGPPRIRSTNLTEPDARPVLVPAGNKTRATENGKSVLKPLKKAEKPAQEKEAEAKEKKPASPMARLQQCDLPSILRRQDRNGMYRFSSTSASCSSDASSTDSSQSRASSSGRVTTVGRRSNALGRRKQCGSRSKTDKVRMDGSVEKNGSDTGLVDATHGSLEAGKRCAWVTHNTEPCYAAFHDEEWGVPIHDDKKLFELLSLSGALAELTWPAILSKRHMFREAFLDFDPIAVSKRSEKRIISTASSLLSELKLRGIIENARQSCKIINEFGSLNKYIWNFVNHKPIISQFRYPRQVPVKTPKAEAISKDLVRRGFRSVGPTVIYSFMQAAGLTNDHLITCFRFHQCIAAADADAREGKPGIVSELGSQKPSNDLSF